MYRGAHAEPTIDPSTGFMTSSGSSNSGIVTVLVVVVILLLFLLAVAVIIVVLRSGRVRKNEAPREENEPRHKAIPQNRSMPIVSSASPTAQETRQSTSPPRSRTRNDEPASGPDHNDHDGYYGDSHGHGGSHDDDDDSDDDSDSDGDGGDD